MNITTTSNDTGSTHGLFDCAEYTFIGELKDGLPSGKGVAFFRQSGKIY